MFYAHITGWGHYLPKRVLTNDEIADTVDTSHDWIYTRTGISSRRIAHPKETTATMAFEAAARALARANLHASEVDLIVVATSTPEYVFPSTASQVQSYLGARKAGAFDLSAACTGFVYALEMASNAIATGSIKNAIVIGAEMMSRITDWHDRGTCILFGDGAGAVVLQSSTVPGGVQSSSMYSDGSGAEALYLPQVYDNVIPAIHTNGIEPPEKQNLIHMQGRQVFRFATSVVPEVIQEVADKAGWELQDIDLIVPHQANSRILDSINKKLKIPMAKIINNVENTGNTSAASIPIALCEAVASGRLRPNDKVIFVGFGGGLTWAATALEWLVLPPDNPPQFLRREWKRFRYVNVRRRARWRQWARATWARFAGSPTPKARLKDADRKKK